MRPIWQLAAFQAERQHAHTLVLSKDVSADVGLLVCQPGVLEADVSLNERGQ